MARPRPTLPGLGEVLIHADPEVPRPDQIGTLSSDEPDGLVPDLDVRAPVVHREEAPADSGEPASLSPLPGVSDEDIDDEEIIEVPELPRFGPPDEPPFLYLAGDAGTGKSYTVRQREANYRDAILLATTGIAAVNLGGTTINSALRYFDSDSMRLEYEYGRLGVALKQLYDGGIRRLCIDEISMMDGRQLDILCLAVDDLNQKLRDRALEDGQTEPDEDGDPQQMGVTLTGDFAQLPPVGADRKGKVARPGTKDRPWDGTDFCFNAQHWKRFGDSTVTLKEQHRQADPEFLRAINQLRRGDRACVPYFTKYITPTEEQHFDGSTILATNAEVDRYNAVRMLQLPGIETSYHNIRSGEAKDLPSEWKHVPDTLTLKPNALVMILANGTNRETKELIYANGDLGHYEGDHQGFAMVRLLRTKEIVFVARVLRERLKPGVQRFLKPGKERNPDHILATLDYMPLRVAYGTTVHKVQGLTLDRIQLMINSQFWLQSGMLYVGVSRVKTPEGLWIVGTPSQFEARVRVNPILKPWL